MRCATYNFIHYIMERSESRLGDNNCRTFEKVIAYDGQDDALFCMVKYHAFTRELLDSWVHDICCTGITFREAHSAWIRSN